MKTALSSLALAAAITTAPLLASSASAETKLGALTCYSEGSTGFIIGSSENLVCEFSPANDAQPKEIYNATLNTFGLDVGVTGETVMQWIVLAASLDAYAPNSLAGTYVGASADASVAAGGGVNLLVGGPQDGFTLQPVSLQAQEGINAAIGVSSFTLEPASTAAQPK